MVSRSLWRPAITFSSSPAATPLAPGAATAAPHPAAGAASHQPRVRLEGLWHRYKTSAADAWTLRGVDLELGSGELLGLLGPSGCGKTTLLRLIAGFEQPERGRVWIDAQEVAGPNRLLPPERRGVGMVFQDYALFPHLDAWANARFGLRRGQDPERVHWLLELLGLQGLERRFPHELSGGQRQRLALARALAPEPSVVLLDEPFSNLDVEVRQRLRSELPAVLAECGACALLVTHDPQEALAICDRVAVLRAGQIEQWATPLALVRQPATAFVGRFVLQANLLPGHWWGDRLRTALGDFEPLPGAAARDAPPQAAPQQPPAPAPGCSEEAQLFLRPTDLRLAPLDAEPLNSNHVDADQLDADQVEADDVVAEPVEAEVLSREFLGRSWLYLVELADLRLRVRQPLEVVLARGERCRLLLEPGAEPLLFPGGLPLRACP